MSLFSFRSSKKENRSNVDEQNPCYDNTVPQSMSLSNLLKLQKGNGMNIAAFFDAVNIISNAIAKIPFVFKNEADEELRRSHYLWHLFDNSKITRFNTIKNVVKDILIHGNGFIYIERDPDTFRPVTLHYSNAEQTSMYYNPLSNSVYYMNPTFSNRWDDGTNYLHFYINSNNGIEGIGIPVYAYKTINLAASIEKSASDFWSSGGQLNALISANSEYPNVGTKEKQIQSLRQAWDEARSRSHGTGIVFVPADLKYQPLSSSAKDSALIESRIFNVEEIARWFSLSPVLLGDYSHSHYNSLSDADTEFVKHCLQPYIVMIEEEMQRKLVMPSKQDVEFIDLDENAIISIDKGKQADYLTKYVERGILTPNEVRKILGYPAKEGADELSVAYSDANQNKITGQEDTSDKDESEDKNIEETEDE